MNNLLKQDDDWYCRKCTARRGEAGEWKPEKGEQGLLDILPIRESTRVSSPQGTPNHQVQVQQVHQGWFFWINIINTTFLKQFFFSFNIFLCLVFINITVEIRSWKLKLECQMSVLFSYLVRLRYDIYDFNDVRGFKN